MIKTLSNFYKILTVTIFIFLTGYVTAQDIDGGASREYSGDLTKAETITWLKQKFSNSFTTTSENVKNIKFISLDECMLIMQFDLHSTTYRLDLPTNITTVATGGDLDYGSARPVKMYATIEDREDDYYNFSIFLRLKNDNELRRGIEKNMKHLASFCTGTSSTTTKSSVKNFTTISNDILDKEVTTTEGAFDWLEAFFATAMEAKSEPVSDIVLEDTDECSITVSYKWNGTAYFKVFPTDIKSILSDGTLFYSSAVVYDRIASKEFEPNYYSSSTCLGFNTKYQKYFDDCIKYMKIVGEDCDDY